MFINVFAQIKILGSINPSHAYVSSMDIEPGGG